MQLNKSLFRQTVNVARGIKIEAGDSDKMKFNKFKTVQHYRHDLLHILVSEILQTPALIGTNPIGNILPKYDFSGISTNTPDIVHVNFDKITIIDVCFSLNRQTDIDQKEKKYLRLLDRIDDRESELMIIAVHPDLHNLDFEISKLRALADFNFDQYYSEFKSAYEDVSTKLSNLRSFVPEEFLSKEHEFLNFRSEFELPSKYKEAYIDKNPGLAQMDDIKSITYTRAMNIVRDLYLDDKVCDSIRDKQHSQSEFDIAFNNLRGNEPNDYIDPKPSFHFAYCPHQEITVDNSDIDNFADFKQDQKYALNILKIVSRVKVDDSKISLCNELFAMCCDALKDPIEHTIFNTGFYTGNFSDDREIKEQVAKSAGLPNKKVPFVSIRRSDEKKYRQDKPYFERSHQIATSQFSISANIFKHKSGVNYVRHHPEGRKYNVNVSCHPDMSDKFQDFYDLVGDETEIGLKCDQLLKLEAGLDSQVAKDLKEQFRKNFRVFYNIIGTTHAAHMSYHTSLAAEQAIHYSSLNTKESSFYFANTGLPNVLHVFQGCTFDKSKDVGCPFFTIMITTNKRWASPVFGGLKSYRTYINGQMNYVIITDWKRLQIHKLSLLRDQFYSCMSTGFDTYMRNLSSAYAIKKSFKNFIYTFRTLVAQSTSQRVAEFLMDVRYVTMSCFADYTNVTALIADKFCQPYPNCFTRWIVKTLEVKTKVLSEQYKSGTALSKEKAVFVGESRVQTTVGGYMLFTSIWTNHRLTSMQDLFDELFVYVHTGKEPSSNFIEGIKSLKTILKFQNEYDTLSLDHKHGNHTIQSFSEFIQSKKHVGYWSQVIESATREYTKKLKQDKVLADIDRMTAQEVLSEIVSTKACIPEYKLQTQEVVLISAKKQEKIDKKSNDVRDHLVNIGEEIISLNEFVPLEFSNVHPDSVINPKSRTHRAKVHDCCLDFSLRFPTKCQNTLDVAHWNIFENKSRVDADICIKSQYGAKREFYVINFGAKAMARMYENMYKGIAMNMKNEMISVPGDEKLIHIQNNINSVLTARHSENDLIYYVNGDCTKWSACETMGSFWSMAKGFDSFLKPEHTEYSKCVLAAWGNKKINIPNDVLRGTKFITSKTLYMKNTRTIDSTQNFLQGMFNYSSSVKAVIATEFAIDCWKFINNNSRELIVAHLEHSDDYSLIVRSQTKQDFEDFRVVHKICQKLFGINDSEKKTNCQQFLLEFISLMSFNGHMAYPNIKKTKEVGINVAGTGYQNDIMNCISRAGECVRLGVPQCSAYVVGWLQGINIYRKYSIGSTMRNDNQFSKDPYNTPIEFFGIPDVLPAFCLNTTGDPNNYRIFRYVDYWLPALKGLYVLTQDHYRELGDPMLSENMPTFYTAQYIYQKLGQVVKKYREKIGYSYEKVQEILDENPEFLICKPRESGRFTEWLKYMYYNPSFSVAYTSISRKMISLRLSFFSSGFCIVEGEGDNRVAVTISEHIPRFYNLCMHESGRFSESCSSDLERLLSNTDPTLKSYYDLLDNCSLIDLGDYPDPPLVGKFPQNFMLGNFSNSLISILQYISNPKGFFVDRRQHNGFSSLEKDINKLRMMISFETLKAADLLAVNRLCKAMKRKNVVGMLFSSASSLNTIEQLISRLASGTFYHRKFLVKPQRLFDILDPFTNSVLYSRDFLTDVSRAIGVVGNSVQLLYMLKGRLGWDALRVKMLLKTIRVRHTDQLLHEYISNIQIELESATEILHKRMFCFMRVFLCDDYEPLRLLVGNQFAVRFAYYNDIEMKSLKSSGICCVDAVAFTFRKKHFCSVRGANGRIVTLCNQANYNNAILVCLIAQRLFNTISQATFEKFISTKPESHVGSMSMEEFCTIIPERTHENFRSFSVTNGIIKLSKGVNPILPTLLGGQKIFEKGFEKLSWDLDPEICLDTLCCISRGQRLFTLPLYPSSGNMELILPNLEISGNIKLDFFQPDYVLQNYLFNKNDIIQFDRELFIDIQKKKAVTFNARSWGFNTDAIIKFTTSNNVLYSNEEEDLKPTIVSSKIVPISNDDIDLNEGYFFDNIDIETLSDNLTNKLSEDLFLDSNEIKELQREFEEDTIPESKEEELPIEILKETFNEKHPTIKEMLKLSPLDLESMLSPKKKTFVEFYEPLSMPKFPTEFTDVFLNNKMEINTMLKIVGEDFFEEGDFFHTIPVAKKLSCVFSDYKFKIVNFGSQKLCVFENELSILDDLPECNAYYVPIDLYNLVMSVEKFFTEEELQGFLDKNLYPELIIGSDARRFFGCNYSIQNVCFVEGNEFSAEMIYSKQLFASIPFVVKPCLTRGDVIVEELPIEELKKEKLEFSHFKQEGSLVEYPECFMEILNNNGVPKTTQTLVYNEEHFEEGKFFQTVPIGKKLATLFKDYMWETVKFGNSTLCLFKSEESMSDEIPVCNAYYIPIDLYKHVFNVKDMFEEELLQEYLSQGLYPELIIGSLADRFFGKSYSLSNLCFVAGEEWSSDVIFDKQLFASAPFVLQPCILKEKKQENPTPKQIEMPLANIFESFKENMASPIYPQELIDLHSSEGFVFEDNSDIITCEFFDTRGFGQTIPVSRIFAERFSRYSFSMITLKGLGTMCIFTTTEEGEQQSIPMCSGYYIPIELYNKFLNVKIDFSQEQLSDFMRLGLYPSLVIGSPANSFFGKTYKKFGNVWIPNTNGIDSNTIYSDELFTETPYFLRECNLKTQIIICHPDYFKPNSLDVQVVNGIATVQIGKDYSSDMLTQSIKDKVKQYCCAERDLIRGDLYLTENYVKQSMFYPVRESGYGVCVIDFNSEIGMLVQGSQIKEKACQVLNSHEPFDVGSGGIVLITCIRGLTVNMPCGCHTFIKQVDLDEQFESISINNSSRIPMVGVSTFSYLNMSIVVKSEKTRLWKSGGHVGHNMLCYVQKSVLKSEHATVVDIEAEEMRPAVGMLELDKNEEDSSVSEEDFEYAADMHKHRGPSVIPISSTIVTILKPPKQNKMSLTLSNVMNLPPLDVYITRCMTGYSGLSWINNPKNVYSLICLVIKLWENRTDLDELEKATLKHYLSEAEYGRLNNHIHLDEFQISGVMKIVFDGYRFNKLKCIVIYRRDKAEHYKKLGNHVIENEDHYIITLSGEAPVSKLEYGTSIILTPMRGALIGVLLDLVTEHEF